LAWDMMVSSDFVFVIANVAKPSSGDKHTLDCFVARAPRNDEFLNPYHNR